MEKWHKYVNGYLSRDLLYQKIHPLTTDATFDADRFKTNSKNFENHNSQSKKWILVMLDQELLHVVKISEFNL